MNKDTMHSGITYLRTALEKALVREDDVSRSLAMLLFLKRLTDLADHSRSGTSFIPAEFPRVVPKLANTQWLSFGQGGDPAPLVRSLLEKVEAAIPLLSGVSNMNALVYSLHEASKAKVNFEPVFTAVIALPLGKLSDSEMIRVFQDALDAPSRHAASATTPASVRELVGRLFATEIVHSIYDPALGTGSLITDVADRVRGNWTTPALFGQEVVVDVLQLARIRAFLSKCPFQFRPDDTLLETQTPGYANGYSLVVAHPPFGKIPPTIVNDPRFTALASAGVTTYEIAFLQHVIGNMSDAGRAAVVVPSGVLSRSADRELREHLVTTGILHAVVGLPPFLFSGTDIPASILVLRSKEIVDSNDVVFVDLGGSIVGPKTAPTISATGIAAAVRAVGARNSQPGFSSVATAATLADSDFDLSVGLYVRPLRPEGPSLSDSLLRFADAVAVRNDAENKALALLNQRSRGKPRPNSARQSAV
jgi:hypothetical protein